MAKQRESRLSARFVGIAEREYRLEAIKLVAGRGQRVGLSDVLVALPGGRCLWVETKMPGHGRVRPSQRGMAHRLAVLGHRVVVARTVAEFRDELDRAIVDARQLAEAPRCIHLETRTLSV